MRIAILGSRGIPARHGGFETFAEGLATRLVEQGHVVTVYCEGRRVGRPRTHRGVDLVYVPLPPCGCLRPLAYDLAALIHASLGHDVVYLLGYGAAAFGVVPRVFGRRLWINMDGLEWQRAKWSGLARHWFRWMERIAMRVADRVVFDAQAIRDDLVARLGQPRGEAVLPYAAEPRLAAPDHAALASLGLEADGYHLVVCRLEPENHVLELIEGHGRSRSRLPLVLVTERTHGTNYAAACRSASHAGVRWLGPIWDRDVLTSLRAGSRSYLHGHSVGGTNPSLLEAMACGNLCIVHDNPFTHEVLAEAGLYFTDARAAGAALVEAERLPEPRRRALGQAARTRIAGHYSWDLLLAGYQRLLADERTRSAEPVRPAVPGAHAEQGKSKAAPAAGPPEAGPGRDAA